MSLRDYLNQRELEKVAADPIALDDNVVYAMEKLAVGFGAFKTSVKAFRPKIPAPRTGLSTTRYKGGPKIPTLRAGPNVPPVPGGAPLPKRPALRTAPARPKIPSPRTAPASAEVPPWLAKIFVDQPGLRQFF